jgi:hypothetical protein
MDFKALFGLTVIPAAILGGSVVACLSRRICDLFLVLLVVLSPMMELLDVNFVSRNWYRGTALGFQVSIPDVLAMSLLAASLLRPHHNERRIYWPPGLGLLVLFFLYACFSVTISTPRLFGLFELFKMARGFIFVLAVALYLRSERELRLLVLGLALLIGFEGLLALKQRYMVGYYRVPGTVDDANSLSMLLCLTLPVLAAAINSRFALPLRGLCALALALGCVAEVMTISRAGISDLLLVLTGVAVTTMSYRLTARKLVWTCLIAVAATAVAAKAWHTVMSRFEDTSLKAEYENRHEMGRGYYLRVAAAILREHWLGIGLNNWSYWVSNRYGPRLGFRFVPYRGTDAEPSDVIPSGSNVDEAQAAPAHCLGALTAGELGIPGLFLFTLVWLRWFQMGASFLFPRTGDPMRRMGVGLFFGFCGIFIQSLTEWVFRQSPIYFLFHVLLGALASLYFIKRREKRQARIQTGPAAVAARRFPASVAATFNTQYSTSSAQWAVSKFNVRCWMSHVRRWTFNVSQPIL